MKVYIVAKGYFHEPAENVGVYKNYEDALNMILKLSNNEYELREGEEDHWYHKTDGIYLTMKEWEVE